MRFNNVCLEACGYVLPQDVVPSTEIERRLKPIYDRLKMSIGRLELMTGIRERRFWPEIHPPSTYAVQAAEKTIKKSGIDRSKIGCLIHASVCRDFLEPATATYVHQKLKLRPDAFVFDISNACLGVLNGMVVIANMIELGQIEAGLVVAAEDAKSLLETTVNKLLNTISLNRKQTKTSLASLTIGSGAVAVLLTNKSISKSKHEILGGVVMADSAGNGLCRSLPDRGFAEQNCEPIMHTDSESMLVQGCELARDTFKLFLDVVGWSMETIDRVVTHQVGKMHRQKFYENIGVDIKKDVPTLEFLGNVGSVSLPISLAIGAEKGQIKEGDKVAMLGIGSGLNSMMLGIKW
jgi:acyl-CoA:acyl-CoA alkyltransferase